LWRRKLLQFLWKWKHKKMQNTKCILDVVFNQKKVCFNNKDRMISGWKRSFNARNGLVAVLRYDVLPIAKKPVLYCTQTCISTVLWQYWHPHYTDAFLSLLWPNRPTVHYVKDSLWSIYL
jgi:hypothetical protein